MLAVKGNEAWYVLYVAILTEAVGLLDNKTIRDAICKRSCCRVDSRKDVKRRRDVG